MLTELERMDQKLQKFSNNDLLLVWECLEDYDPSENYAPGISMDDWATAVYYELTYRRTLNPQNF